MQAAINAFCVNVHCIRSMMYSLSMLQAGKPQGPPPNFVQEVQTPLSQSVQYDVIMCGGTLGIFLACSLQLKGLK